jgi:deazaflavin-dependent oxidoreductase (nitroreductase family)
MIRPRVRARRVLTLVWRLHRWLYRRSGGRVGGRLVGMPVLLLVTVGRRSGRPHTTALTYLPHGPDIVIIASNGGAQNHPDWFLNLRAHPEVEIDLGRRHLRMHAQETAGPEREALWARVVHMNRRYAGYQARTKRRIPVVVLTAAAR